MKKIVSCEERGKKNKAIDSVMDGRYAFCSQGHLVFFRYFIEHLDADRFT